MTPFPIQAIHDRVIIFVETPAQDGLVALPEIRTEPPCIGVVMSVGSGRCCKCKKVVPIEVDVGDRVVFNRYGQKEEIRVGGVLYFLLPRSDLIAVYPEAKPFEPQIVGDIYGRANE